MKDLFGVSKGLLLSLVLIGILIITVQLGLTQSFDVWGVEFFRDPDNPSYALGGESVKTLIIWFTHSGDSKFLALIAIFIIFLAYRAYGNKYAIAMAVSFFGPFVLTAVLKALFGRIRPDIVPQFVEATSASFPSGHTLRSTVVYFLVAFFILRGQSVVVTQKLVIVLTGLIIVLNGLSRVYLGVHWPTDILAGWLMGMTWILVCTQYLRREEG